jgi:hypothetical protein
MFINDSKKFRTLIQLELGVFQFQQRGFSRQNICIEIYDLQKYVCSYIQIGLEYSCGICFFGKNRTYFLACHIEFKFQEREKMLSRSHKNCQITSEMHNAGHISCNPYFLYG